MARAWPVVSHSRSEIRIRPVIRYDTVIGERGATLSGGQRQRIAIARAIIRDSPILILDEPSSGLDAASEELVFEALGHLTRDKTAIVIAHRLTTVRRADVIFVLQDGVVVESGATGDGIGEWIAWLERRIASAREKSTTEASKCS